MDQFIGKKSFGEVVSCKYKPNSGLYAAKKFLLHGTSDEQKKILFENFKNELELMKKINYYNIVSLFGQEIKYRINTNKFRYYFGSGELIFVMDIYPSSLERHYKTNKKKG
jgi:serine/threonine protein kinase